MISFKCMQIARRWKVRAYLGPDYMEAGGKKPIKANRIEVDGEEKGFKRFSCCTGVFYVYTHTYTHTPTHLCRSQLGCGEVN